MRFARIVYAAAAVYGFLSLVPLYFLMERIGQDVPPPITHPEFFYGFAGVALLWQVVFVLVARDPQQYRPIMLVSVFEKLAYTVPVLILYALGNANPRILQSSLVDPIFGVLFIVAYVRTR